MLITGIRRLCCRHCDRASGGRRWLHHWNRGCTRSGRQAIHSSVSCNAAAQADHDFLWIPAPVGGSSNVGCSKGHCSIQRRASVLRGIRRATARPRFAAATASSLSMPTETKPTPREWKVRPRHCCRAQSQNNVAWLSEYRNPTAGGVAPTLFPSELLLHSEPGGLALHAAMALGRSA